MNTYSMQPLAAETKIECAIAGCNSNFETTEPVLPQARFLCRHHSREDQVTSAGRSYAPDRDEQDTALRFQERQFDKSLRGSKKPFGTSHIHRRGNRTKEGDESTELLLKNFAQSLPRRFSVQTVTNYESSRHDFPDWVKSDLVSFIINRLDTRERNDLLRRKVPLWAALDHAILVEYYLLYTPDEEILDKYRFCLQSEAAGKKRWTSSVNALKNRRLRLVKEGNAMFGENETADQADGAKETRNDNAALIRNF
jgi:hypothetical protein